MSTLRAFDPLAPPTTPTNSSWFEIHLYVLLYFATKLQHNPHATKHHEKYCQRFQENVNQNQENLKSATNNLSSRDSHYGVLYGLTN